MTDTARALLTAAGFLCLLGLDLACGDITIHEHSTK